MVDMVDLSQNDIEIHKTIYKMTSLEIHFFQNFTEIFISLIYALLILIVLLKQINPLKVPQPCIGTHSQSSRI